jgi:hypothetical protein
MSCRRGFNCKLRGTYGRGRPFLAGVPTDHRPILSGLAEHLANTTVFAKDHFDELGHRRQGGELRLEDPGSRCGTPVEEHSRGPLSV